MARERNLFQEQYSFHGEQYKKVLALTEEIDSDSGASIFSSVVELFITAAVVGCYFNKREKPDKSKGGDDGKKIFPEQFTTHAAQINTVYRLVLLTGDQEHFDAVARLNKAFRNPNTQENYNLFEEYMLGGVSMLYDALCLDTNNQYEDYLTSINKLLDQFSSNDGDGSSDPIPDTDDFFKDV